MELPNPQDFATRAEAARVLGVSTETLRRLERRNEGPKVVRVSPGRALYPNVDLVLYLKNQTRGSVGGAA